MPFDKIIMNPPYNGSLHLKILSEAMKHSDDIVNLSPIRWLQDPLAEYKKNSDWKKFEDIRSHIESLEVVPMKEAMRLFDVSFTMDLGIYHITDKGGFDCTSLQNATLKKIYNKILPYVKNFEYDKKDGVRIKFSKINGAGGHGKDRGANGKTWQKLLIFEDGKRDGKWWYEHYNRNQFTKEIPEIPCSISFDNKEAAEAWLKVAESKPGRWFYDKMTLDQNVRSYQFLWLPDYTHPWTDEMLYEYFGLTPDEIEEIENALN